MAQIRTTTSTTQLTGEGLAVLRDENGRWLHFEAPVSIIETRQLNEIQACLAEIIEAVEGRGLYAAGYLAYEAAPAFDPALRVCPEPAVPLLWFGLYESPAEPRWPARPTRPAYQLDGWEPSITPAEYHQAIAQIKEHIARGNTYQVNYTFRLRARFEGDPYPFFQTLADTQQGDFPAFIDTGRFAICSASPELFFRLSGDRIMAMPMKGTAARGRTAQEDAERMRGLRLSPKDQAENVMIVDMVRNDIGRIAKTGTVEVARLFDVRRYPTVLQMTSTVTGRTQAGLPQILGALFPCASITGAPKVRTSGIIAELETGPRGVYTGCIGYLAPGRKAQFNVAIRTVTVDRQSRIAEYGVGGGIVWDSESEAEFQESWVKARVLTAPRPRFELLETLLWEPNDGFFLLKEHLARLARSARYFDIPLDQRLVEARLASAVTDRPERPQRVRLLVDREGGVRVETAIHQILERASPLKIALADKPVDREHVFLFHKTTQRQVYEEARAAHPECDDVLLWNHLGELTEATLANVVIESNGRRVTPPVHSGLLAGTFRQRLLEDGVIEEQVIQKDDLRRAGQIYLINSVRKWMSAQMS